MSQSLVKKSMAEAIGTFILVFMGCGAIIVNQSSGQALGHVGVSLVFGLSVAVAIFAVGSVSGAHINPAVTFGLAISKRMSWNEVPGYLIGQFAGAISAAIALKFTLANSEVLGVTAPSGGAAQAFWMEIILTAFLMFVIMAVTEKENFDGRFAALSIGCTIAICAFVGGPITGASMNPARSFGPALVSGQLSHVWIYFASPLIGAALGSILYAAIQSTAAKKTDG